MAIRDVVGDVRENVIEAVEVNISVNDVHLPEEEEEETAEGRVQ